MSQSCDYIVKSKYDSCITSTLLSKFDKRRIPHMDDRQPRVNVKYGNKNFVSRINPCVILNLLFLHFQKEQDPPHFKDACIQSKVGHFLNTNVKFPFPQGQECVSLSLSENLKELDVFPLRLIKEMPEMPTKRHMTLLSLDRH